MKVEQIYTGCLAQGAYYIQSGKEAVIIDPLRETKPYLEKLEEEGATLKYIFETHFHADFVSGHVDLAKATGAKIIYGPTAKTEFESYIATDGEEFSVGDVTFKVLHTPGHTPESTTYLLKDGDGEDYAIFTGDTLFIGDVGRPDLAQKAGSVTMEDLAGWSYDSLRNKIMPLADEVIVYPGHGAGSACGKNMSDDTWDTLGHQKQTNYALRADMTREEFIKEVTTGLAPPPQYFAKNAALNKKGYESISSVLKHGVVPLTAERFEELANLEDALVLDTRSKAEFAQSHIPNSIFVGIDGNFAPWVGALIVDIQQPILLLTPKGREEEVVTRLARVGYDNTLGYLNGGIEAWKAAGKETDTIESIPAYEFEGRFGKNLDGTVIDVRRPGEFTAEHVENAVSFPLDFINSKMEKLDRKNKYYVYCASGFRSLVASSILRARGFKNLVDVAGGIKAIEAETKIPRTDYVCPSTLV